MSYYSQGRYAEAEPLYKGALAIFEKSLGHGHPKVAAILNNLAELYRTQGRSADAEPLYKRALAIDERALRRDHPDLATDLNNLAGLYENQSRYADAEPLFQRALAIREKALGPDHPDVATNLNNLAELYYYLGRYAAAEPLFKRSLAIREKARGPDHPDVAASLNNLAVLYREQGHYAEAEPLYRRALATSEKALGPDHPDLATSLNNLAGLYRVQGRYVDAGTLYVRALAIKEKSLGPDHPDVAMSLNNLAGLYDSQGRYADAEPLYRRALATWEKALGPDDPRVAAALNNLASLYASQGRYVDAGTLYVRALAIKEKSLGPDHPDVAVSLNNLAGLYESQSRYADAEPFYQRSLAIREKALGPDDRRVATALNNLAGLYRKQGRYAEAEPLYKRSLAIYEKALGPDHPDVAMSLNNLATLYGDQGRSADAEPLFKRSLAIYGKALGPDHPDVATSLNNLAMLYAKQSRYTEALPLVRTATKRGFVSRQVHLSTLYGARGAGLVTEANAVGESFSVVQQASSSAASAALGQLAVRFAAGSGELAQLARREQDLAVANDGLDKAVVAELSKAPAERNKDKEQALHDELKKTMEALTAARSELGLRFPDYAVLSRPQVINLADAQSLLGDDEALVLIDLAAPDATDDYVWAVTRNAAVWKKLATKKGEIADEVAALRAVLDPNAKKPFDAKLAYALYEQTLGPVEDIISSKHQLLMVMNGALTSLPPQVLITADPAGKTLKSDDWLIRHYAVTVLPSVSSLKVLSGASARSAAGKSLTGYGNPVFKHEGSGSGSRVAAIRGYGSYFRGPTADVDVLRNALPALPETAIELQTVAKSVGAGKADILLGNAATETAVKQAHLDQYRIVYFATHALVAGEVEQFARIKAEPALAMSLPDKPTELDDGLLTASEVAQLKLDADMVVLSACNTASGDKPGADALSGLARAFFYAGARSLIVSHWPVDSAAAVKLMTSTFAAMAKDAKLTPAQALTKSMLAMIDDPTDPEAANPALWAPFVVVGEARPAR